MNQDTIDSVVNILMQPENQELLAQNNLYQIIQDNYGWADQIAQFFVDELKWDRDGIIAKIYGVDDANKEIEVSFSADKIGDWSKLIKYSRDASEKTYNKIIDLWLKGNSVDLDIDTSDYTIDSNTINDINKDNIKTIADMGVDGEHLEKICNNDYDDFDEDEDGVDSATAEQIHEAILDAYRDAQWQGACDECEDAIIEIFEQPPITANRDSSATIRVKGTLKDAVDAMDNMEYYFDDRLDYEDPLIYTNLSDAEKMIVYNAFKDKELIEPYYGWYNYEKDTFNDILSDRLSEI